MAENRLRVICGPTAAGKSAVAAALAMEYSGTVISADSRQIYRGFDIGTAKPAASELKAIPHRGIDIVAPEVRYSASEWAASAETWIDEAESAGRVPVIVGGTGFYVKALFEPLFESPRVDPAQRSTLEKILGGLSLTDLQRWCGELDPHRSKLGRTQLIRAIEVALLTGYRISALHETEARQSRHIPAYLVVDPGIQLADRIVARIDKMIDDGWLNEVRNLDSSLPKDAPAWKASGYRTMRLVARDELDLSSARARIIIETCQYAKRQRTWFRHQLGQTSVTRVDPTSDDWEATVHRWWKETS
ncbi:MAG: tRNA (adenosine(37)-N6)-dimethylallyltransferase MiaA [Gemmatimonadaceae bacterium]